MLKYFKKWGIQKIKKGMIYLFCFYLGMSSLISYFKNDFSKSDVDFYSETPDVHSAEMTDEIPEVQNADSIQTPLTEEKSSVKASSGNKVNINTASESELESLKGIGPAKAQAIIEYRKQYGPFVSIEQITEVSGIGEGTFLKLKDSISIE